MSHFSKIKTNITDFDALLNTINQLGFDYKLLHDNIDLPLKDCKRTTNIAVYQLNKIDDKAPVFTFIWNGEEYMLMADVQLWNLDVDFNYLLDRIFQQYAYNMVINTSYISGFNKIQEELSYDGSVKITLQRWNNN